MSKVKGFTVALDRDVNSEYAEFIREAITMIKGVSNVESVESDPNDFIIESRYRSEVRDKMLNLIKDI